MQYYSTNHNSPLVSLQEAVVRGLAPDKGLYMPQMIRQLPVSFFQNIETLSFQEIANVVAESMFGEDIDPKTLQSIVEETLCFDTPIHQVSSNIYALELFHGPTLAFKDVGARFMARLLSYFIQNEKEKQINVLVATSGDTGSAVANGFLGVEGINVYVLYPKGKVSAIQECQFTTLGQNIVALEIDGTFDDCQALVKSAFMDQDLNHLFHLTSANSINVARFLPQSFYYFYAYAQLKKIGKQKQMVVSVPSGNFGNLTAGLIAHKMGLPIKRFIAANNANNIFYKFLETGVYTPKPSLATLANAMDVGDPSNFVRMMDLYSSSAVEMEKLISAYWYKDEDIRQTISTVSSQFQYLLDPHGACGYQALKESLSASEVGVFLETAHPAKFKETVESVIQTEISIPSALQEFMQGEKCSVGLSADFMDFKNWLRNNLK